MNLKTKRVGCDKLFAMNISIAERLRPFQHVAGTKVLLPGTALRATIYPSLILFHDVTCADPRLVAEVPLTIHGPVQDFTVQQDLEKGCLLVWGFAASGYFRYTLSYNDGVHCSFEKGGESFKVDIHTAAVAIGKTSRLSLGNHKAQDWSLVGRRKDLKEVFPAWLRLGQLLPTGESSGTGTVELLTACREVERLELVPRFQDLFAAGFEGILSPRLSDTQHQGFGLSSANPEDSPLVLLTEGAKLIQSLFVDQEGDVLAILPKLPPEFHSGRLVDYTWNSKGTLDLEWTKKFLRRMVLRAEVDATVHLRFQKALNRFRLNGNYLSVNQPITIEAGKLYVFDRFES